MTGEDGDRPPVGADAGEDQAVTPDEGEEAGRYRGDEWFRAIYPGLVLVTLVVLVAVAWWLLRDTGEALQPLQDVEERRDVELLGYHVENHTTYGPHAHAINLTLREGDRVSFEYKSTGPPGGVQVRLQRRLGADEGGAGGGPGAIASAVGDEGNIEVRMGEGGAYQVYIWHPGVARPPDPGDDPDPHITAAVSYHLVVERAIRP